MKKLILLIAVSFITITSAFAQPGYLGRKTFVDYYFFFSPEVSDLLGYGEFRFATKHTLDINQVISRKDVLGAVVEFGKTPIVYRSSSFSNDERFEPYDIKFKGFGIAWYNYGGKKSVLAPLGNYWGIKAMYYKLNVEGKDQLEGQTASTGLFSPRFVFGKKKIWGHFTVDLSLEIDGAIWRYGSLFSGSDEFVDGDSLEEVAVNQFTQDYIFGLNLAVGYIFKSPLGK